MKSAKRGRGLIAMALALSMDLICLQAHPADAQIIGPGTGSHEVNIPISYWPQIGFIVQAHVNGSGPYNFVLNLSAKSTLSSHVIDESRILTKEKTAAISISGRHLPPIMKTGNFSLAFDSQVFNLSGVDVIPIDSATPPIENFGGTLGLEIMRGEGARLDIPGGTLTTMIESGAPDGRSLPLFQLDFRNNFALLLSMPVLENSRSLLLSGIDDSISFPSWSKLGMEIAARSPVHATVDVFGPLQNTQFDLGTTTSFSFKTQPSKAMTYMRDLSKKNAPRNAAANIPPIDGSIGLQALLGQAIVLDSRRGTIFVEQSNNKPALCTPDKKKDAWYGFGVSIYRGRSVAGAVVQDSPASRAGLRAGDEIVEIDGQNAFDYFNSLRKSCGRSGDLKLTFKRGTSTKMVLIPSAASFFGAFPASPG